MEKQDYNYFAVKFQETKQDKWFERLYECLKLGLTIYVQKILKYENPDLVHDVVSEAFIRAYLKIDQFKPKYSFTTWLYRIAFNLCLAHIKENKKTQNVDFTIPTLLEDENSIAQESETDLYEHQEQFELDKYDSETMINNLIHRAISEIDSLYGKIIFDYHFNSMSYADISDKYNLNMSTVKTRIHRARQKLEPKIKSSATELINSGYLVKQDLPYETII